MPFTVFKRSARNFEEFSSAEKITVEEGIATEREARAICGAFNNNRTPAEEEAGTKLEYTEE